MTARSRMQMRAEVKRDYETGTDPLENPLPPRYEVLYPWLPCWYWQETGRTAISEEITAVIEDRKMIVPKGTDITEADRVTRIWNRRGDVLSTEEMLIKSVNKAHSDHYDLALESVQ